MIDHPNLTRRAVIGGAAAAIALSAIPAGAAPEAMAAEMQSVFGGRAVTIREGRVVLTIPSLAENGNSVPLTVEVPESPMTEDDFVRTLYIFSEKNPLPNVARFHFGPRSGSAKVATRIRLADSQIVTAVAEMNDGSLWSGTAQVVVTLAACIDLS